MHTDFSTFLSNSNKSIRNDLARLKGARFVCAVEAENGSKFSEVILKQVTGGEPITVRFLHQEYFEYHPEYKIFLAANHKPNIQGKDDAIWRRIHLIPFKKTICKESQDKMLLKTLKNELSGILTWALEGCREWQHNGLIVPDEVKNATIGYRKKMDIITQFFDDCLIFHSLATVSKKLLYINYLKWCGSEKMSPLGKIFFNNEVSDRGYSDKEMRVAGKKDRVWLGIGLENKEENIDLGAEDE
jgi:putative DNA primase/helicase